MGVPGRREDDDLAAVQESSRRRRECLDLSEEARKATFWRGAREVTGKEGLPTRLRKVTCASEFIMGITLTATRDLLLLSQAFDLEFRRQCNVSETLTLCL